jgi:hypothetical protein
LNSINIGYIISGSNNWSKNFNENNEYKVGDNTVIEIEVDMKKKMIFYFINNKQCGYYVSDVSSSLLLFGISGIWSKAVLEVLSVKKMMKSSADPSIPYKVMKWKKY